MGPRDATGEQSRRLMRQPEIKGPVLRGAVPLQLYQVITDNAPNTKATFSHMQLTRIKRADTQLQHRVPLFAEAAQHAPNNQGKYYNLLIH